MQKMNGERTGLLIVVIFAAVVCAVVFFARILPADVFVWDEGHHALYGTMLTDDIKAGDWDSFWMHTHRQTYWPFFHSWTLTVFFLLFGVSYVTARAPSLLFLFLTVIATYFTALRISRDRGWLIGIIACVMLLSSPMLVGLSTENMTEALGTFLFALSTLLYLNADRDRDDHKGLISYGLLGLVFGITMVTKYNYALALIPALGMALVIDLFDDLKAFREGTAEKPIYWLLSKYLLVLVPLLLITVSWFTSYDMDRKIGMVVHTRNVHANLGLADPVMQNIYYLKIVVDMFTPSKWLGGIVLLSILGSLFFYRNRAVRACSLSFILSLLITNAAVGWRLDRGFVMEAPWAFLIFGFMALEALGRIRSLADQRRRLAAVAAIAILMLPALAGWLVNLPKVYLMPAKPERVRAVMDFFRKNIPADRPVSAAIGGSTFNPYLFMFHFRGWRAPVLTIFNANAQEFLRSEYFLGIRYSGSSSEAYADGVVPGEALDWGKKLQMLRDQGYIAMFREKAFGGFHLTAEIYKRVK